jgi:hypothetical protein
MKASRCVPICPLWLPRATLYFALRGSELPRSSTSALQMKSPPQDSPLRPCLAEEKQLLLFPVRLGVIWCSPPGRIVLKSKEDPLSSCSISTD